MNSGESPTCTSGILSTIFLLLALLATVVIARDARAQETRAQESVARETLAQEQQVESAQAAPVDQHADNASLLPRLEHLEARVAAMERIVFATSQLSVYEAERRVQDAERQLREHRELFLKGLLADRIWQSDRLQVDILRQELAMARAASIQKANVCELDVLQAKQNLIAAEGRLEQSRNLALRGYATQSQVQNDEELVRLQKQQLELAEEKLAAAKDLQSLDNTPPTSAAPAKPTASDQPRSSGDSPQGDSGR